MRHSKSHGNITTPPSGIPAQDVRASDYQSNQIPTKIPINPKPANKIQSINMKENIGDEQRGGHIGPAGKIVENLKNIPGDHFQEDAPIGTVEEIKVEIIPEESEKKERLQSDEGKSTPMGNEIPPVDISSIDGRKEDFAVSILTFGDESAINGNGENTNKNKNILRPEDFLRDDVSSIDLPNKTKEIYPEQNFKEEPKNENIVVNNDENSEKSKDNAKNQSSFGVPF